MSPLTKPIWVAHAREFAVTTNGRSLALAAASCDERDIVTFLQHSDVKEHRQIHPSVFTPIVNRLIAVGRLDEACVIRILGFRFVASAMAELETYDGQLREFIEATCADLAKESAACDYPECHALFLGLLATGAAKLRRDAGSFALFDQAILLARELVGAGAHCYAPLLAGLLSNLGNALRFAGRHRDAIHALSESVTIRRRCSGHDAEQDQRHLASALSDRRREQGYGQSAVGADRQPGVRGNGA